MNSHKLGAERGRRRQARPPARSTPATLANGAVTSAKLANNAVTNSKIANGVVGTNKLGNEVVTTSKLAKKTSPPRSSRTAR